MTMTPDELAAVLRWLYAKDDGTGWLPAAAVDLRIAERNLRGMMAGKVLLPQRVSEVLAIMVAAHTLLAGWEERTTQLDQLPLGPEARHYIDRWRQVFAP